jgi:hypothetical protein
MLVSPVKVFLEASVTVPEPIFWKAPEPLIVPVKEIESLRLNKRVPSLWTLPTRFPSVPPSPICSVPATTSTPESNVVLPVRIKVPAPSFLRELLKLVSDVAQGTEFSPVSMRYCCPGAELKRPDRSWLEDAAV